MMEQILIISDKPRTDNKKATDLFIYVSKLGM